ncbi:hypothetical protein M8C21_016120 [Ambrosia artemisiifolia]|uniref:Phloem protein 2-like protein n=1 Tax=Ambrosia artemisiifolia TaxID=4212 RepID=A0AAD5C8K1_AMBAR|nr:hypothetical protein M8C21_016120 [Ambrosia artemisiifolia]
MAYEREDGLWICELYQFTSDHRTIDLHILFDGFHQTCCSIQIEGIEFWPMEKVQHKDENQPILDSDSDTNWEEKMPTDYEHIMKLSKNSLQWTTKKEAYSIIRKGFFINFGETKKDIWFYLDKNGKKCHMLSMAFMWKLIPSFTKTFFPESRFGEAVQWDSESFSVEMKVQTGLLSSETTYAIYLVYKLPKDHYGFKPPVLEVNSRRHTKAWYSCLSSPQTPVIRPKANQNTHNPRNRPKMKGFPQERNDGWMELQIWELQTPTTYEELTLAQIYKKFDTLIIEGFEFRPI